PGVSGAFPRPPGGRQGVLRRVVALPSETHTRPVAGERRPGTGDWSARPDEGELPRRSSGRARPGGWPTAPGLAGAGACAAGERDALLADPLRGVARHPRTETG